MSTPLVEAADLRKQFTESVSLLDRLRGTTPTPVRAVDGVSFEIRRGETLGLVGESGCGKTTTGQLLLGLQPATAGTVSFDGQPLSEQSAADRRTFHQETAIVFQEPFASVDPRFTVERIVREPLDVNDVGTADERTQRVRTLLDRVELSPDTATRYPHELSGGQCQRVAIARALALDPSFVVLDEPVSALDVSVQAQICSLLADLQSELELTYLFITHDLSVVSSLCDRVAVMYLGEIVELGPTAALFESPAHPYTQALLDSVPRATAAERAREITPLAGDVPSPSDPPAGCRFHPRCPAIIPPAALDIDQDTYRTLYRFRDRIARGASVDPADRPLAFETDLDAESQRVLDSALSALDAGDRETALETLDSRFESICETTPPDTHTPSHRVTCHRHAPCRDHNCE